MSTFFNRGSLVGGHDFLGVEVLQLVVLWHELGEYLRKFLDLRSESQLFYEPIGVFFEFFRLDLLICVNEVNTVVQVAYFLATFIVLACLVLS